MKYGLIPELIGRIPVLTVLDDLDKDALVQIMTKPKNSIVKQYQTLFEMDGVTLEFQDEALSAIADITLERKTGARGLRSVFEAVLNELMFSSPSDKTIEKIVITDDAVKGIAKPLIYNNPNKEEVKLSEKSLKYA